MNYGRNSVNPAEDLGVLPKVFCIGFHKTGTTSLARALKILGYRVCGAAGVLDPDIARNAWEIALPLLEKFDAFRDNPWPVLYKSLDEKCPGSKFIHTHRPSDKWIQSVVRHFGPNVTPMRDWIYGVGSPVNNEDVYIERYERHNREVSEYFAGRPKNFLSLDITSDAGWDLICAFLDKKVPNVQFPWINRTRSNLRQSQIR